MRLFGHDIFISHAHSDAAGYAIALARALQKRVSVFIDLYDSAPGVAISPRVVKELRSATMLVLISSPAAAQSKAVAEEIEVFARSGRPINIIDAGVSSAFAAWAPLVAGRPRVVDSFESLRAGQPNQQVIDGILDAFTYRTRRQRLTIGAVIALLIVLLAILSVVPIMRRADVRVAQQHSVASAEQIASTAKQAWNGRSASADVVLLLAAESLRRSPTTQAFQLVAELTPLNPALAWEKPSSGVKAAPAPKQAPANVRDVVRDAYEFAADERGAEVVVVTRMVSVTVPERPQPTVTYYRRAAGGALEKRWDLPLNSFNPDVSVALTPGGVMIREGSVVSIRSRSPGAAELLRLIVNGSVTTAGDLLVVDDGHLMKAWRIPPEHDPRDLPFAFAADGRHALLRLHRVIAVREFPSQRDVLRRELAADFLPFGDISADGGVAAVALMPALGGGGFGPGVQVLDTKSGSARTVPSNELFTTSVAVSADGKLLAYGGNPNSSGQVIRLFDAHTLRQVDAFNAPAIVHRLAFTHDDGALIGIDIRYRMWRRDLARREMIDVGGVGGAPDPHASGAALVSQLPDGQSILVMSRGVIEHWPLHAQATPDWSMPATDVASVASSADGSEFAMAIGRPSRVVIYQSATRKPVFELPLPFDPLIVTFPAASRDPVVLTADGQVHTIHRDAHQAAADVCRSVGRSLTPEEWGRYIQEPYVDTCGSLSGG